jgi:hypothetical protein
MQGRLIGKFSPFLLLCRTSSEQSPFEVPATKEGENFLHGFDTALRALTLDYARLSTNLRSIRNSLDFSALAESNPPVVGPHKSKPHHPGYCKEAHRSDLHCNAFKRATGTPFASLGVMSGRLSA